MEIYINALMESDAFVRDRRDYSLIAVIKFPKIALYVALRGEPISERVWRGSAAAYADAY